MQVRGAVAEGDYIVPNGDGTGSAVGSDQVTYDQYRKAVGIAWETHAGTGIKNVLVAIE